jgi:hypothetical protein
MGLALITDAAIATTVGAGAFASASAGVGSSLTVRNSQLSSPVALYDMWKEAVTAGQIQITSPKIVPISHGIQAATGTGVADFLLHGPPYQALTPQDQLTMQLSGGATEAIVGCIQAYYNELPGIEMRLKTPSEIEPVTEFVFGYEVAAVASATPGGQGNTNILTSYDGTTANRWYALLGYITATPVAAVGISGIDTSASFVGGPGDTNPYLTSHYFADLSMRSGKPCIPLFNAANKGNTNVTVVDRIASTTTKVTLVLAELEGSYQP